MSPAPLWARLKGARIVQVLLVYLGASWVVLQITDTVTDLLKLPEWVGPVALLLLFVGLVVVLATAWVQALPQTTAAEEAGEVPTDWEVAPADAMASLKAGKLPHLTWGRAILGGVMAMSLLFGAGGLFVMVKGPTSMFGPEEAGASAAASGIAVLPFHVTGPDLEVYREGMVDLVSANLDGLSDYRAIDARTVLARWNRDIGETSDAELDAALRVAAGTGARYAIVGSGVEVGGSVRFTATVYDLSNGEQVGDGRVEGSPDNILALVDELTVGVMRSLLESTGQGSNAQTFRLASVLTSSVPALRDYLEGDALFRRGRFVEARELLQRAVEADSTFALAHWRLGEAIGWETGIGDPDARAAKLKATEYLDRLPAREATLLRVSASVSDGTIVEQMPHLRSYIQRYPDDPDGWYLLGEAGLHTYRGTGVTDADLDEALFKTVALDPTFGPYYDHAVRWAVGRGDQARFDAMVSGYEATGSDPLRSAEWRFLWDIVRGDDETRARAAASLDTMSNVALGSIDQSILGFMDDHLERLQPLRVARKGWTDLNRFGALYDAQGRLDVLRRTRAETPTLDVRLNTASFEMRAFVVGATSRDDAVAACAVTREAAEAEQEAFLLFVRSVCDAALGNTSALVGAWPALRAAVLRDLARDDAPIVAGDTVGFLGAAEAITRARLQGAQGDPAAGYRTLLTVPRRIGGALDQDWLLGDLAFKAGQWGDAIAIYEGMSRSPGLRTLVKFRLGQAYEAAGDTAKALDAYRAVLSRTVNASPEYLADDKAREAVARLGG